MLPLTSSHLAIYLNDHLAGATAGTELARRAASSNRDTGYGSALAELAEQIAEDREALTDVMRRLGVGADRMKVALSWGAEKAGRLKLNGRLVGYSPLSRLEEIEILALGVEGKLSLWQALRHTHGDDPRLDGAELGRLIERARTQRRRLARLRRRAAEEAL